MATDDTQPEGEHEHRHTIIVGHAPLKMYLGVLLDDKRACRCGDQVTIGYRRWNPEWMTSTRY